MSSLRECIDFEVFVGHPRRDVWRPVGYLVWSSGRYGPDIGVNGKR